MTICDKIRGEKLQYVINTEAAKKNLHYHLEKLKNMSTLKVRKYYLLIKEE